VAERVPASLLGALADLVKWLESAQISAMVVGGVASSFLGRPRLTQDVEGLLDAHPEVNFDEIRQHVSDFAAATSMSDLIDDFERLLQRRKSKQSAARPRPK
jgi:hypothetical protein